MPLLVLFYLLSNAPLDQLSVQQITIHFAIQYPMGTFSAVINAWPLLCASECPIPIRKLGWISKVVSKSGLNFWGNFGKNLISGKLSFQRKVESLSVGHSWLLSNFFPQKTNYPSFWIATLHKRARKKYRYQIFLILVIAQLPTYRITLTQFAKEQN